METYDAINDLINNDSYLSTESRRVLRSNIKKLQQFDGHPTDWVAIQQFLGDCFPISVQYNVINQFLKFYRKHDRYDLVNQALEYRREINRAKISEYSAIEALGGLTKAILLERLNSIPDSAYKLVVWLAVKFPAHRIQDYVNLQFGCFSDDIIHNFISRDFRCLIMNSFVKTKTQTQIIRQFEKQDIMLVTKCLRGVFSGSIFPSDVTEPCIKKYINLIAKEIGLRTFHDTRKIHYSEIGAHDTLESIQQIADEQGHTLYSAQYSYM